MRLTWLSGLFLIAGGATLVVLLWPRWLEIKAQTVELAEVHRTYSAAHPGWSFPARVWSGSAPLDLPKALLIPQARARGYTEACPPQNPGEYCEKSGDVIPRGGRFPEGIQPGGTEGWSRPLALEPIELGVLLGPEAEVRWHLPVEEAPPALIAAILAAEDTDYYQHFGVNPKGLLRAVWANYQGGGYQQGASTLTMQVVRNLNQRKEKTLERKIEEIVSAVALDQHLGKEGVLQMYLDAPYLGQAGNLSICGFKAAAQYYWGQDIDTLSLGQYATLAGILPAPGKYAPEKNPEAAKVRRDLVLRRLEAAGLNVQDALDEPITASAHPVLPPEHHPAYLQATRQWLEANVPPETLYGAGLQVFTALDLVAQQRSEELLPKKIKYLQGIVGRRGEGPLEVAAALVSTQTGYLAAVYGGTQETSTDFNRATQARRQGGSSFKPMVYALAFSQVDAEGHPAWRAHSTIDNRYREFPNTNGWKPRNISGDYRSTSALPQGVTWGQNAATASLLEKVGCPALLIEFAAKMGYDSSKFPVEMGLALGQGEVTPLEQARFVATIVHGGERASASPVVTILDASGAVRLEVSGFEERVISAEGAALTRGIMRQVIEQGTGGAARGGGGFSGYGGPAIGKTGTTDLEKDLWFIGGTPFYAGAVWLGYDQPARIGASASDLAAPLWGWWMREVHQGLPPDDFAQDAALEITRRGVCAITGRSSNGTCRSVGAPFLKGDKPSGTCNISHPPPPPLEEGEEAPQKRENLWKRRQREAEERKAAQEAASGEGSETRGPAGSDVGSGG